MRSVGEVLVGRAALCGIQRVLDSVVHVPSFDELVDEVEVLLVWSDSDCSVVDRPVHRVDKVLHNCDGKFAVLVIMVGRPAIRVCWDDYICLLARAGCAGVTYVGS
jgi:hypothetical protein